MTEHSDLDTAATGNLGLGSWPHRRARIDAEAEALVQGEVRLTYGELAASVSSFAGALTALRVRAGDRVAYLGLNDVLTFQVMFATQLLGATFVPVNHRLAPAEVHHVLVDSGAEVIVVGPGGAALVVEAIAPGGVAVREILDADAAAEMQAEGRQAEHAPVTLDDAALLLYTSGTTGRPKGAVLTHGNLTWNTVNQLAHLDVLSTDHALCISPLFHAVGLGQVTLPVLFKGGSVEVVPRFDAGHVLGLIGEHGVASFSCVPTMLQMMAEHERWDTAELGSLRHVVYGGAPVDERVAAAWRARGVRLQQGYGMTEAGPGVAMAPAGAGEDRLVSVGVPHFFTDVAFLRGGGPVPVEPGERGELLVRGPHVFAGYWRRPDETESVMVRERSGEWYRTGDVLQADQDGWLQVVDRVKDLIISGGENIYPAEVETLLLERPEVRSAAVVARPDQRWGEVGVAYVELVPGVSLTPDELRDHLATRLARFKLPREFVVMPALPRNAVGKVLKHELRHDAAARNPMESDT